jgi:glycosyltransferase involved in cell wall biosynthesis
MIWAERVSAQWACRVVTHSQSHRAKLMASYQLSQVEMIPHGIGLPPWNGTQTGPQTGRLGVLSVGPLTARKGIQTLLRAIKPVVEAVPEVEFWIAGGGADHAKVVKRFGEEYPELAGHVRFLGFVADEELARLYEQCALYVSAAIYESFGLTFVEAMARGKATVGCLAGAVPEIVVHEATGLLVPPSDSEAMAAAIVRLLRHPEERTTMGVRGRERAETRFSDAVMAEGIEKLFESVRAEFSF